MKLLSVGTNTKINKSDKFGGYLTAILHLAPADISGHQVCPWATAGCKAACLNTAGRGKFSNVQAARIAKTQYFFRDTKAFMRDLIDDIDSLVRKCKRENVRPVVRLNGTSDIVWERIPVTHQAKKSRFELYGKPVQHKNIFELFPEVEFYDYTKASPGKRTESDNYALIYSRASEAQKEELCKVLSEGGRVAVVFSGELPATYWGYPVVDGDKNDLRFLDPHGVIVGLSAKGAAKKDNSGFVVQSK